MKRIVLILLAAFLLCSLIIFSTACENHQEQPAMQIELAINSACRRSATEHGRETWRHPAYL